MERNARLTIHGQGRVTISRRARILIQKDALGAGAAVGAGSAVISDVPEKVAVAGNPARIIRKDVTWVICRQANPRPPRIRYGRQQ
jgi:serine acetyltransferase